MSIFSDIQLINIFRLQQPMHKLGKAPSLLRTNSYTLKQVQNAISFADTIPLGGQFFAHHFIEYLLKLSNRHFFSQSELFS